jgi:hypothetical protein
MAGTFKLKPAAPALAVKGMPDEDAVAELKALGAKLAEAVA